MMSNQSLIKQSLISLSHMNVDNTQYSAVVMMINISRLNDS